MLIFSDLTKSIFSLKSKIIVSLLVAACLDQFNFFHFLPLQPNISFLTLYFWAFFFNRHLSFTFVFLLGMGIDLMGGSFLGENTIVFILLYGSLAFYQEHYSNDLSLEWSTLCLSIVLLTILQIILLSLIHQHLVFSWKHLLENGLTLLFYPCIKYGLQRLVKERRVS